MQKIDWTHPILGADGISRSQSEIEAFFINEFHSKINDNLVSLRDSLNDENSTELMRRDIGKVIVYLEKILLAKPERLNVIKNIWENRINQYTGELQIRRLDKARIADLLKEFKNGLFIAFNYEGFRAAKLNRLAVILNVKSCLYCNQQYTIAIGRKPNQKGKINLAGSDAYLQFDHFFDKSDYPILSMSLYNLIPSCPICNQKKSKKRYSLNLHPYLYSLCDRLSFRIKDKNALISPLIKNGDLLEIEIDTFGNMELKELIDNLDLKRRYSRHLDIVQEIEYAQYLEAYYNRNYDIISDEIAEAIKRNPIDYEVLNRHLIGFYGHSKDINKRPLSKFCQDIYSQLKIDFE